MAIEDMLTTGDALEFAEVEQRVVSERYLVGDHPWPHMMRLPVKRIETCDFGYVQRDRYGVPEPIVYHADGPIRCRRYETVEQLLEAGWRVD